MNTELDDAFEHGRAENEGWPPATCPNGCDWVKGQACGQCRLPAAKAALGLPGKEPNE